MAEFLTSRKSGTNYTKFLSYSSVNLQQPLISIVIPAYNRWNFLQEAVASVIAQTNTNWELVIVDDGSTDGTKEKIALLNDQRIHVLSLPHCGNIALLRNAGVAAGSGEWLTFLDSDDLWLPEKLELQLLLLQQHERSWSYGGSELINESRLSIAFKSGSHTPVSGWITKELLANKVSVPIGSLMLKRTLLNAIGGFDSNPELIFREDYELTLRLSLKAEAVALQSMLVRVREHPGRSTNALSDGNKRTAFLYGHFAKHCTDKKLKKIAIRRQAHHITEMAVENITQKKYWQALLQLGTAFWKGDKLRHMLSALRHTINTKKK